MSDTNYSNVIQIKHGSNEPKAEKLAPFELGYSTNLHKLYIKNDEENATLQSFSSDERIEEVEKQIAPTQKGAFYATGKDEIPSFGVLPVSCGGTGLESNPSILVNLESTSVDDVLKTAPRPGVIGVLPLKNGGMGDDMTKVFKVPNAIIRASSDSEKYPYLTYTATNNGAFYATEENGMPRFGTLPIAQGGTGLKVNPALIVNLESIETDTVFKSSPTPGIKGILPLAHGGTGVNLTSNPTLIVDLGSPYAAKIFQETSNPGVQGILPIFRGGTGAIDATEACKNLGALKIDYLGTSIAKGTNLNTLTTPDVYYSPNQEISGSLVNTPCTSSGFKLIVMMGYSSQRVIQIAFDNAAAGYIRVYTSSKWTEWRYL